MSELDEIRSELATLREQTERGLAELRREVATARGLPVMAARDANSVQAAIAGMVRVQNALRETQLEHGDALRDIAAALGSVVAGQQRNEDLLRHHDVMLMSHAEMLTALMQGQQHHSEMLAALTEGQQRHDEQLTILRQGRQRQDEVLQRHDEMLTEILRRLPPAPVNDG